MMRASSIVHGRSLPMRSPPTFVGRWVVDSREALLRGECVGPFHRTESAPLILLKDVLDLAHPIEREALDAAIGRDPEVEREVRLQYEVVEEVFPMAVPTLRGDGPPNDRVGEVAGLCEREPVTVDGLRDPGDLRRTHGRSLSGRVLKPTIVR